MGIRLIELAVKGGRVCGRRRVHRRDWPGSRVRVVQLISFLLRAMDSVEVELGAIGREGRIGDWRRNHARYRATKALRGCPDVNGRARRRGQFFIWLRSTEFRGCRHRGLAGSILFASEKHTRSQRVAVAVLPALSSPSPPVMLRGGGVWL